MKARKFYRGLLPSIVWDPENNRPLADFSSGTFVTKSKKVADALLEKGYLEVSLNQEQPPVLPDPPLQDDSQPNARPIHGSEAAAAVAQAQQAGLNDSTPLNKGEKGRSLKPRRAKG